MSIRIENDPDCHTSVWIYINDEPLILLPSKLWKRHFSKLKAFSPDSFKEQLMALEQKIAFEYCIRVLALKNISSWELQKKMATYGITPESQEAVIARLRGLSFLNNEQWVVSAIESFRNRKLSTREIGFKLYQKGVPRALIEQYLQKDGDLEALQELIKKKSKLLNANDPKSLQKLIGYLMRKGFEYDHIRTALNTHFA